MRILRHCFSTLLFSLILCVKSHAVLTVDDSDPHFESFVIQELNNMRDGKRGIVCQILIQRIDESSSTTTIKPLTQDENTWHPNDRKGTRSHVVALDTKVRGANRNNPTSVILYIHPSRVDPNLSLFKTGSLARELAEAMDLNRGQFSGDYKIQEKRENFFRNAWRDSLGLSLISMSGRVPTDEFQEAKKKGLIEKKYADQFPILFPDQVMPIETP